MPIPLDSSVLIGRPFEFFRALRTGDVIFRPLLEMLSRFLFP